MLETLLRTKLFVPPLRPKLVPRPQLIERLNQGLQLGHKLTLVSAPAGFGKTTLISSWIRQLDMPEAWLSLDEGDNEPNRFVFYMIAALREAYSELGESAVTLMQSPQPPPTETLLTLLINDLAKLTARVILVLDDYHVIQNLEIHKTITFLLDNQPPRMQLVIISRSDPVFPLHRLRGSGQMIGIYVRDLRFTGTEVASFLNETMGLSLSPEEVATIERRTEGWVAGLQLAALSMQEMPDPSGFVRVFAGDDRYISDYLIGEVFEHQPAQFQEFLLRTAILDRFSASLCDALLGVEGWKTRIDDPGQKLSSRTIIERLDQSNLFIISLDNKRTWYRYHHLFADFLRLRLRERPSTERADLHHRAATWYAQHGFTQEAVHHCLLAEDFTQAADLIERVGVRLIVLGQHGRVLSWLAELPDDLVHRRPLLCVCHAWILTVTGQAAAFETLLRQAEQALPTVEPDSARHIKGLIDMLRAYRARNQGNLSRSIKLLRQASESLSTSDLLVRSTVNLNLGFNYLLKGLLVRATQALEEASQDSLVAGAVYIQLIAMAVLANSYVAQGKLRRAIALYEEAIAYGLTHNHDRPFPPAGYAYAGLGQVMYEQNKLEKAEQLLTKAIELGESIADWSIVRRGLLPLAWLRQMAGNPDAAQELWQQALKVVHEAGSERVEAQLGAHWVRLQLTHALPGSSVMDAARKWARAYQQQPDTSSYQEVLPQMTLAQVELAQGRIDQASLRLNRLAERAAAGSQIDNLIKIQTLQAVAHNAKGESSMALKVLDEALVLAAPEGYVRTFVDHGSPMRRLLREAAVRHPASDYVVHLLAAFPAAPQEAIDAPHSAIQRTPAEPLTEREQSILRLIAAGLSNREIAAELFLSINTIKTYTSRIYGKLDVHRRAEAVDRAHDLGLL